MKVSDTTIHLKFTFVFVGDLKNLAHCILEPYMHLAEYSNHTPMYCRKGAEKLYQFSWGTDKVYVRAVFDRPVYFSGAQI